MLEKVKSTFKGGVYRLLKAISYSEKGIKGLTTILLDEMTNLDLRLEILKTITDSKNLYKNNLFNTLLLLAKDKSIKIRKKADYYLASMGGAKSQTHPQLHSGQLLNDIMMYVPLVIGEEVIQAKRIEELIALGPNIIQEIEATIQNVAAHGESDSEFKNAGLLCEAIGRIGGKTARDVLTRFSTTDSLIWEYRHIKSSAKKGLLFLDNDRVTSKVDGKKPERIKAVSKVLSRESIPALLDIAEKQVEEGECINAVRTFLQAVEIDPMFMISSSVWFNIASIVTGERPPRKAKNWIKLPKEFVPEGVASQLARLPNYSLEKGFSGPYIEPPSEMEIRKVIVDLHEIIQRYENLTSISD